MLERMWDKGNTPALLVGMQAGAAPLDFCIVICHDPAIPLLGIYSKDAQLYPKKMCSTMFIAALFVIARTWKQPKCPLNEEWIKKLWYIYTMEYYTAEKKIMTS